MSRKFVIYLKGVNRGIVITDDDTSKTSDDLASKVAAIMSGYKICEFKTKTDCIIIRPSEITGIHIQGGPFSDKTTIEAIEEYDDGKIGDINETIPELDLGEELSQEPKHVLDKIDDLDVTSEKPLIIIDEDTSDLEDVEAGVDTVEDEVSEWHSNVDESVKEDA